MKKAKPKIKPEPNSKHTKRYVKAVNAQTGVREAKLKLLRKHAKEYGVKETELYRAIADAKQKGIDLLKTDKKELEGLVRIISGRKKRD